jgi:hypothetical protein
MPRVNFKVEWLFFIGQRILIGALKVKWPMGQMSLVVFLFREIIIESSWGVYPHQKMMVQQ